MRTLVSFKDVQLAYLMDGISAVQELVDSNRASKSTVRRALKKLQEAGRDVSSLERWVAEHIGPIGRGRAAPIAGEMRSYKAQQIKNSGPFLRLPLDALGAQKGSTIRVNFENDRIVVIMNSDKSSKASIRPTAATAAPTPTATTEVPADASDEGLL